MPQESRYGGTVAPCDDPAPCEVSTRTGFRIATQIDPSNIPGAGLGRFALEPAAAGSVLRSQRVGTTNLLAFRSEQELLSAFPLPEDLAMLADFAFCSETLPGVVLLDSPPTLVNHANDAGGSNTAFRFDGDLKEVVATRDIKVGEEFLQDYRSIAHVDWLDLLLQKAKLQSARQLGDDLEASSTSRPSAGASPQWEKMWNAGGSILQANTAFDTGGPCKALVALLKNRLDSLNKRQWKQALVPGGGRGYDAYAIASSGIVANTVQLDLSQTATNEANKWVSSQPATNKGEVEAHCGNFFEHTGEYDLAFDCTFMCALDPSVRVEWAKKYKNLLNSDESELWTLIFPIRPGVEPKTLRENPGSGPPYSMSFELVEGLLMQEGFSLVSRQDLSKEVAHMAGNPFGATSALACWKLTT